MFTILYYSSALEYSIIRRYTNIVYYYLIQEDLNHLLQLSNKWLLPFNIEKCEVLHDIMMNDISVLRIWV